MADVYGIDPNKKYNEKDVRDGLIKCYADQHKFQIKKNMEAQGLSDMDADKMSLMQAENMVLKYFIDNQASFEEPTKEDLIGICESLREYALNFRSEEKVQDNYEAFMDLIEDLE